MRKKEEKEQEKKSSAIIMCFDKDKERIYKSAYNRLAMVCNDLCEKLNEYGEQPTADKLRALLSVNRMEIVSEKKRQTMFVPTNGHSEFLKHKDITIVYEFAERTDADLFAVLTGDKLERLKAMAFDKFEAVLSSCSLLREDLDLSVISVDDGAVVMDIDAVLKDKCATYANERGAAVLEVVERAENALNELAEIVGADALELFRYSFTEKKVKRLENINYNEV